MTRVLAAIRLNRSEGILNDSYDVGRDSALNVGSGTSVDNTTNGHRPALLLLLAVITLYGCVLPIPTPENKVLAGTPVAEEQLTFIELKETTKADVLARIGEPQIIWEDTRIFVYEWEVRQGILIWAVGAGYSGGFGALDLPARYVLIIQFGDTDRVKRFERTTRPALKTYGEFLREWASQP